MLSAERHAFLYKLHRQRVLEAKCRIDMTSPVVRLHKQQMIRMEKVLGNAMKCKQIYAENARVLHSLDKTMLTTGRISTFRTSQLKMNRPRISKLPQKIAELQEIEYRNAIIGRKLQNITSTIKTQRKRGIEDWRKRSSKFQMPWEILRKYNGSLQLPKNSAAWEKLMRPVIYFDIAVHNKRPLGRLIIELFTEACPQVVLEFVRACRSHDSSRLQITHLFPKLWLGGRLQLQTDQLNTHNIEYDMRAVDHGCGAGVLSFARHHLKEGFQGSALDFAISFRPLNVLNGERLGFGRVIDGLRLLKCMDTSGTRGGLPLENFVVIKCGTL